MLPVQEKYEMTVVGTRNESTRERWLEQTLKNIPPGSRILDAGAGEQKYRRFCSHLEYVALDFAMYDGLGNGKGLQTGSWNQSDLDVVSDITSIPEPDSSFDAIMCIEVFEHLPEPVLAIREFARLLRKGGYLIVTAPFCSLTHLAPYHYASGYNSYYYRTHLGNNGIEIAEMVPNGNYFEYMAQEVRRISYISDKYCSYGVSRMESFLVRRFLQFLEKLNDRDHGSEELLCFGYHVLARKM